VNTHGRFVVFEGPEGAGKSTQIRRLASWLEEAGLNVFTTREPGGSPLGDRVRDVLLDPNLVIDAEAEFLLYAAARAQHVRSTILPALETHDVVLCDRFAASSAAYQGYGRGLDLEWVNAVNAHATLGLNANLTLLLDLAPEVGLARVAARGQQDRLEQADLAFHERVRHGFLTLSRDDGWTVIDAAQDEAVVHAALRETYAGAFGAP
jgi:dTMP kinase